MKPLADKRLVFLFLSKASLWGATVIFIFFVAGTEIGEIIAA